MANKYSSYLRVTRAPASLDLPTTAQVICYPEWTDPEGRSVRVVRISAGRLRDQERHWRNHNYTGVSVFIWETAFGKLPGLGELDPAMRER
jgi:hypothetical protein